MWIHLLTLGLISGAGGSSGVTGTLAQTNANDALSAAGSTTIQGTLARTNANDTSAASGSTTIIGTLARTNANDALSASGSAGAITGTLAATNANDALSAQGSTPAVASSSTAGAPGGARPFVAYINGQRFSGSYWQIRRLIEEYAEQQAEKEITSDKPPKKPRIVVEPGKAAPKQAPAQVIPEAEGKAIQTEMRHTYQIAYARAKLALQLDEEDALMVLL